MLWEGDVAAGDSGSPVRTGKHRLETGCHAPEAKTWIQAWGKMDIKEVWVAPGPERARPATLR